jgi:CheY-like chemotaxis protein
VPLALICTNEITEQELEGTVLFRQGMERRWAASADQAQAVVREALPALVLVDRDLPAAALLISSLRRDPQTRRLSIAVVARGELRPQEVELLAAGANAILRLPPHSEWEDRLPRLLEVPARREARLAVQIELEARERISVDRATGTAINLSVRGMLLECDFALELGDVLDVFFRLPDAQQPILGCARVMRRAGPRRFGLEFFGLEGDGEERVRRFVASVS